MATRKKTLRRLNPDIRKIVKIADEVLSAGRRLKSFAKEMNDRNVERLVDLRKKEEEYLSVNNDYDFGEEEKF